MRSVGMTSPTHHAIDGDHIPLADARKPIDRRRCGRRLRARCGGACGAEQGADKGAKQCAAVQWNNPLSNSLPLLTASSVTLLLLGVALGVAVAGFASSWACIAPWLP